MEKAIEKAIRRQAVFWAVAAVLLLLLLWVLGNILLPFVAGMALAYFLDPVADMLERLGLSRLVSTTLILFAFILAFVLAMLIIVPILANQTAGFLERLPDLVKSLQAMITSLDIGWLNKFMIKDGSLLQDNASELVKQGAGWIGAVISQLWASGQALLSIFSLLVITPVVAFYLLYDWDRMVAKIDAWLPRDHRNTIHAILVDIDAAVAGFVRGQGTLCLMMGLFYGTALTVAGLNFGLLIGIFAGFISFIPYVGSITGLLLSLSVALVQFWPQWHPVAIVALVFFVGQFLEGNVLQPKLVGERVGLHPVWVMFALFGFGAVFGFTGLLVAVPTAAAFGVVIRFALGRYLESDYYHGREGVIRKAKIASSRARKKA